MKKPEFAALFFFLLLCPAALAQNTAFTYQGFLKEGNQPANGTFHFRFSVVDAPVGGNQIAGPVVSGPIFVSNGLFVATLDFGSAAYDGSARWLGIAVRTNIDQAAFSDLLPAQRLTSTPYALFANGAQTALSLMGGGAGLTNVPGTAIQLGSVGGNQLSSSAWQAIAGAAQIVAQAQGDRRYAGINLGRGSTTPYDCGAVGDGETDDTAALQTWLNNATASNLVAFLPSATGPYFKITDSLWVTNSNGLKLVGAGGEFHTTGIAPGRAHIRQFTPGKHGIAIADSPANVLTDSVHIEGISLTTDSYSPNSYGLAFLGTNPDTDCNVIQECGIQGFGVGLYLGSVADLSVISCSLGKNGDGVLLPARDAANNPAIINSIKLQTCQLSYNYSN